jgi:hypothetical protein
LSISGADEQKKIEGDLITRLSKQFPNDVGIWCVFFLQHFTLEPGQAVFLPANEPHAYIYGGMNEPTGIYNEKMFQVLKKIDYGAVNLSRFRLHRVHGCI